jgi:hypothetical protein
MLAKLKTFSLVGIDALPVEVDVSPAGLPITILVGLPEQAVKESTHRVERAIANSGFQRPQDRVVINLAPACSRLSQRDEIKREKRIPTPFCCLRRCPDYQGVAFRWENAWAFSPSSTARFAVGWKMMLAFVCYPKCED